MKHPSIESSRLIPAANNTGRVKIAYQGRLNAAAPPASTSSPTSVAVSKPSPNSSPTGYMCQGLVTALVAPDSSRLRNPRLSSCASSSRSSYVPAAHLAEDPDDADQHHEIDDADDVEERPRHGGADDAGDLLQDRGVVLELTGQRTGCRGEQGDQSEDDARMAEGEPEPDGHRPLALGHQLAGGVVDRGDVVGVEGVPHAQRVRGQPETEAEDLGLAHLVVLRDHDADQHAPAEDVQQQDERRHADDRSPFPLSPAATAGLRQISVVWGSGCRMAFAFRCASSHKLIAHGRVHCRDGETMWDLVSWSAGSGWLSVRRGAAPSSGEGRNQGLRRRPGAAAASARWSTATARDQ